MSDRPDIPVSLYREVLMEAGHRCAIPRCQQIPVEVAHIVPWKQVREHRFENLCKRRPRTDEEARSKPTDLGQHGAA
jgi:hypothetical protein